KSGTGFVIPVRPIERYEPVFDENHMPKPVAMRQEIEPWKRALATLLSDREAYQAEADASRAAALQFVSGLRATQFEEMLVGQADSLPTGHQPGPARTLSPARRALLLQRLRERSSR